jgi:hypothetical protein
MYILKFFFFEMGLTISAVYMSAAFVFMVGVGLVTLVPLDNVIDVATGIVLDGFNASSTDNSLTTPPEISLPEL